MFCFFSLIPFISVAHLLLYLLPTRNSDLGSHSRLFYPLPATVRAFVFIARRFQPFLPSSTRIELCLPTPLQGALFLFLFLQIKSNVRPTWGSNPGFKHKWKSRLITGTTGATGLSTIKRLGIVLQWVCLHYFECFPHILARIAPKRSVEIMYIFKTPCSLWFTPDK